MKRDWIEGRGFQPAKTSKGPRAMAISGLWLSSVNWEGFWAWRRWARSLSGWIWRGRAFAMERILGKKGTTTPNFSMHALPSNRSLFSLTILCSSSPVFKGLAGRTG